LDNQRPAAKCIRLRDRQLSPQLFHLGGTLVLAELEASAL
jgi:hypothetical protein